MGGDDYLYYPIIHTYNLSWELVGIKQMRSSVRHKPIIIIRHQYPSAMMGSILDLALHIAPVVEEPVLPVVVMLTLWTTTMKPY